MLGKQSVLKSESALVVRSVLVLGVQSVLPLESVSVLAAFLGPTKAVPLIRAIELLESHFEKGAGVLSAVQARLARRQLPRVTSEGLVDYALQIPPAATRADWTNSPKRGVTAPTKWGSDVDWILAGNYRQYEVQY